MKELFESDLNEVFLNEDEFAKKVFLDDTTNSDEPEIVIGIFDSETEVIFEGGGEFSASSASVPSFSLKVIDANKIGFKHIITIGDTMYRLHSKDDENAGLIRVFLEKKR